MLGKDKEWSELMGVEAASQSLTKISGYQLDHLMMVELLG